jgi:hypothetical protein
VQKYLPECQATMTNPHYKTGPRIKLFPVARVEAIEASEEFQAASERPKPRREASTRAIVARKARMRERLERITIAVPRLDWQVLIEKACKQYQHHEAHPAMRAARETRPELLDRMAVNYLRHGITLHHRYAADRRGRLGVRLARTDFLRMVLGAIAETYPALQRECDRQQRELEMRAEWNDR